MMLVRLTTATAAAGGARRATARAAAATRLVARQQGRRGIFGAFFPMAKKVMPKISATERAALDAGTVGFDGAIFTGDPKLSQLDGYSAQLTEEEQSFLDNQVNTLCEMLDDHQITQDRDMPQEVWDYMKNEGFFGIIIPKEYGGLGFGPHAHSQIVMKVGSGSPSAGATVAVPNSLGPGELLLNYGTQEQKDYFLPQLSSGKLIPCFGLTAPHSGSDAASMIGSECTVVEEDGQLGLRATFQKRYITLAPVAGVVGLALQLHDPNNLLRGNGSSGITIVLLERDHPGLHMGPRHDPLSASFMNGVVEGQDIFIPMDAVLGGQRRCGFGWNMLMECLAEGRSISLPAGSVAGLKAVTHHVGGYARIRKQFRTSIADMGGVQEHLARIGADTLVATAGQHLINAMVSNHEKPAVLSGVMKLETTRRVRDALIDGMDVLGGSGISRGGNNLLASGHMNSQIAIIVEGANTLTRSMIIFGQGLTRAHPHMYDIIKAIEKDDKSGFSREVSNFITHAVSNTFRSVSRSVFRKRTLSATAGPTEFVEYYESQLSRFAANFAFTCDAALSLGGRLKFEEMLSGRFADVISRLYLGYATLWYYKKNSHVEGLDVVAEYALDKLLVETQEALQGIGDNFPIRPVGMIMNAVNFPTGNAPCEAPSDKTLAEVAKHVSTPSQFRTLMEENLFISQDPNNRARQIHDLLPKAAMADEILAKMRREKRQATAEEQAILDEVEAGADAIIQVDVFEKLGIEIHAGEDYVRPALRNTRFDPQQQQHAELEQQVA